jgi:hypothetical protein
VVNAYASPTGQERNVIWQVTTIFDMTANDFESKYQNFINFFGLKNV